MAIWGGNERGPSDLFDRTEQHPTIVEKARGLGQKITGIVDKVLHLEVDSPQRPDRSVTPEQAIDEHITAEEAMKYVKEQTEKGEQDDK